MKTEDDLLEKNCHNCKYLYMKFKKSNRTLTFHCKYFSMIMNLNQPPCEGIYWEEEK